MLKLTDGQNTSPRRTVRNAKNIFRRNETTLSVSLFNGPLQVVCPVDFVAPVASSRDALTDRYCPSPEEKRRPKKSSSSIGTRSKISRSKCPTTSAQRCLAHSAISATASEFSAHWPRPEP